MIVLHIFLLLLLLIIVLVLFLPLGVDASFENGQPRLCVRAGPVSVRMYPRRPKSAKQLEKERRKKEKKAKKESEKKSEEGKTDAKEEPDQPKDESIKVKKQRTLDMDTILALMEMGVRAIRRFFRSFTVNYFKLHCTAAGRDPYNTAMEYGTLCAAVEGLQALSGDKITLQRRDIALAADFTAEKPVIDVRIIITLQLFRIVHLLAAFGVEYIAWRIRVRREKKAADAEERE